MKILRNTIFVLFVFSLCSFLHMEAVPRILPHIRKTRYEKKYVAGRVLNEGFQAQDKDRAMADHKPPDKFVLLLGSLDTSISFLDVLNIERVLDDLRKEFIDAKEFDLLRRTVIMYLRGLEGDSMIRSKEEKCHREYIKRKLTVFILWANDGNQSL